MWFVLGLFIVGGVWSFMSMGKKEDSTFVLKTAVVTCSYPGATPLQVEQLISEPVARELQSMRGVHKITSESYYGYSKITVELNPATRADEIPQLWDELRRKVTNISPQLPAGAGAIRVNDDFSDVYGLYYGLVADDGFSWSEIRDWAQRIKTDVVTVGGVQKVALFAEQTPVINLYVTMSALANFDITPEMIVATISQQNAIVNSGRVVAGEMEIRVLETGVYGSVEDIADQLLIASDGRQFRLGDIARIEEGYVEPPTSLMYVDGRRAVGIGVSSEPESDVVALGAEVRSHLEQLSRQMPVGMDIVTLYPEDEIARRANMSFLVNLLESVAIVIVVIMLAMGARSGSLIGSSLLFTIGGTMLCMYMTGEGINRTSLAGFIIAMGMLVDNAIVVTDNALTAASSGTPLREALVRGAEGPKWGLLGATLIAVFSFLPLYLAPSAVAEIVKPLFVVIALSLLISWVLALTQVPMFGLMMLRPPFRVAASERFASFDRVLRWMLRHRWGVVAATVALFVSAVAAMRVMPQNFFPQIDKPYFRADIILPEGYDIEATQHNLDTMALWLRSQPEVVHVSTTAGSTPVRYYLASSSVSSRPNFGNILVEVDDKRSTEAVKERFDRFVLTTCPDVWLRSSLFKLSPVPDATIEIGFVGNDIDTLLRLTHDVEQIMWRDGDAVNIRNSWGNRIPVWIPVYSQTKGQRIGVSRSGVAQWMTLATQGYGVGEYRRGDEVMPILLKDEAQRDYNLSNLQSMPVFSRSGRVYPIEQASSRFDFDFRKYRIPDVTLEIKFFAVNLFIGFKRFKIPSNTHAVASRTRSVTEHHVCSVCKNIFKRSRSIVISSSRAAAGSISLRPCPAYRTEIGKVINVIKYYFGRVCPRVKFGSVRVSVRIIFIIFRNESIEFYVRKISSNNISQINTVQFDIDFLINVVLNAVPVCHRILIAVSVVNEETVINGLLSCNTVFVINVRYRITAVI